MQKEAYASVVNLITQTKRKYREGRRLKFCGTVHSFTYSSISGTQNAF